MEIINLTNNILNIVTFCNENKFDFFLEKEIDSNDRFIAVYISNSNTNKDIGVIATPEKNIFILTSYVTLKKSYPFIKLDIENLTIEQVKEVILAELN